MFRNRCGKEVRTVLSVLYHLNVSPDLVVLYVYFPALENVPLLNVDKTRLNITK